VADALRKPVTERHKPNGALNAKSQFSQQDWKMEIRRLDFESAASASSAIPAILGFSEKLSELTGCCGCLAIRVGLPSGNVIPLDSDDACFPKHSATLGSQPGGGSSR
jgi:hypothetical protein